MLHRAGRSRAQPRAPRRHQQPGLSDLGTRGRPRRRRRAGAIVAAMRRAARPDPAGHRSYDQHVPAAVAEDSPRLPPFTAVIGPADDAAPPAAPPRRLGKAHGRGRDRPPPLPCRASLAPLFRAVGRGAGRRRSGDLAFLVRAPADPSVARPAISIRRCSATCRCAAGDALLRAACAFVADGKERAPTHYRALGRSAFLAAALKADRQLDAIARSFDFLLSISPINTDEAMHEFLGAERRQAAALPLPPARGRSRHRQARAVRDRSRRARGSVARDLVHRKAARDRPPADHARRRATRPTSGPRRCFNMARSSPSCWPTPQAILAATKARRRPRGRDDRRVRSRQRGARR